MLGWLADNTHWIWSGIGTAVLLLLIDWARRRARRRTRRDRSPHPVMEQDSGPQAQSVQIAGDVGTLTITTGHTLASGLDPPQMAEALDLQRKIEALRAVLGDIAPDINVILNVASADTNRLALADEMRSLHKRLEQIHPLFQGDIAVQKALTRLGNLGGSATAPGFLVTLEVFELYARDRKMLEFELERLTGHAAGITAELTLQRLVSDEDDAPWVFLLVAKNVGSRVIRLERCALILPDGARLQGIPWEAVEEHRLPHALRPGMRCEAWLKASPLAQALRERGFFGTVELRGSWHDGLDQRFTSGALAFDVEHWVKEPDSPRRSG